jgi:2-polyprenyl-3-methyl-5-hydroxy-6-metoxy-1,4-benzoquinol methylase
MESYLAKSILQFVQFVRVVQLHWQLLENFTKFKFIKKAKTNMRKCQVCGNSEGNRNYAVREMMFGFRDVFSYFECSCCGCLQIVDVPNDLSKYYPRTYYSFSSSAPFPKADRITRYLKRKRYESGLLNKGGLIGKLLYAIIPNENLRLYLLSQVSLTSESRILDVGCGAGDLLSTLHETGFKNSMGIDAYIEEDIERENGAKIRKGTIQDVFGKWDLIMFSHSFEHMTNQLETLEKAERLLTKNGSCLINMPTVSSYAWKHYRENWVDLDAPRHTCIHSLKSMKLLADKANFSLQKITYNSSDLQFWGSEQYLKDIPLRSESSYAENPSKSMFSKKEIETFKMKAKELNRNNQGDSASFLLVKQKD